MECFFFVIVKLSILYIIDFFLIFVSYPIFKNRLQYRFAKSVIRYFCLRKVFNLPPMASKRLITIFFIGILQVAFAQPSCVIQTRYFSDGLSIKYLAPYTIESSGGETCGLGVEMASASNYVTLAFTSNGAPKQLEGDLVLNFTDKNSLRLPQALVMLNRVKGQQVTQYAYYILEKFMNQILNSKIESVSYTVKGGEIKTIPLKPEMADIVKSGLLCLNPLL